MKKYIPAEIEPKWQKRWLKDKLFSPNLDQAKNPYYALMMFPYPSAEGLHVGNMYPFTGTDIFARFKRMQGLDVFEPIGLDGFGIHSENYALNINQHPMELSKITQKRFYEQLEMLGNGFDWTRTVETYHPNYYKWTQWLFLQMYKKGLAYRAKANVNWCPSCLTVLADEQVISGECERCGSKVIKKELEQWFFKITDYAQRLLDNLDWIDWTEKIKVTQKNWIGRSEGIVIKFDHLEVFTTRADTIFGATFVVISPEHPLLAKYVTKQKKETVDQYILEAKKKTEVERQEEKEKTGVFTGSYVKNPLTNQDIPVWVADYVLMGYGTGAIMAVPAHDQRDLEFAKKYGLEIKTVIKEKWEVGGGKMDIEVGSENKAYQGEGVLIDSGEYTGLSSAEAREKISDYIKRYNLGKRQINFHLRDWLISRQRYWGPPIPIIYCDKCGTVPVPEKDLPVELPYVEEFRPTGTGQSPLASVEEFFNVKCPNCGGPAKRETEVSDTFLDSAWYFLRYPSTEFEDKAFDPNRTRKWLPVDIYIGGAEHSVLHLLYARFVTMVMHDLNLIEFEEPFKKFRAHGLIIKEGAKMSKSKGNAINPDRYIKEYGADTLRMYLMFMGPFSEGGDFRDASTGGIYRFLTRVWQLPELTKEQSSPEEKKILNKTIKKVGEDIEKLHFNTAIASLMELLNFIYKNKASKESTNTFLLLLAPFVPHITEELWSHFAEASRNEKWSIHQQSWPKFDSSYLEQEQISIVIQVNGKVRDTLMIQKDILDNKEVVEKMALERFKIQKFLDGNSVKKSVYIAGRVLNLVV